MPAQKLSPPLPPKTETAQRPTAPVPRKETARIGDSPMKATVKLSAIQPTPVPTVGVVRTARLPVATPPPVGLVESVPAAFCWALVGVSALTLLIQLWTYFS